MTNKRTGIIIIVAALVLLIIGVCLAIFLFNGRESKQSDETTNQSQQIESPGITLNDDGTVNIPQETRDREIEVYLNDGSEAFVERVEQDFADSGIEFNTEEHFRYLNVYIEERFEGDE
ncbi:MAG: hypothetical protein LBK50_01480 [Candidatus Nomurabacteria bacterium]|jgi:flagellar basal body-associated protein FliL|nr:hypothetical protein [Candidatus Nomurabacteria bacterium]